MRPSYLYNGNPHTVKEDSIFILRLPQGALSNGKSEKHHFEGNILSNRAE